MPIWGNRENRPADEMPADEVPADEVPAGEAPAATAGEGDGTRAETAREGGPEAEAAFWRTADSRPAPGQGREPVAPAQATADDVVLMDNEPRADGPATPGQEVPAGPAAADLAPAASAPAGPAPDAPAPADPAPDASAPAASAPAGLAPDASAPADLAPDASAPAASAPGAPAPAGSAPAGPAPAGPAPGAPARAAPAPADPATAGLAPADGARWSEILVTFVDDPRGSVKLAADAVDAAAEEFATAVRTRQASIASSWQGGDADTERLRTALRDYRVLWGTLAEINVAGPPRERAEAAGEPARP